MNSSLEAKKNNDSVHLIFAQFRNRGISPFFTSLVTQKNNHVGLIDTGADMSIIHYENMSSNALLIRKNAIIRSATGEPLKIIGQVFGLEVRLGPKEIIFSSYITKEEPKYTIIGLK